MISHSYCVSQEFDVEKIPDVTELYDKIVGQVIGKIIGGVETFETILSGSGDASVSRLFESLGDAIEAIPPQIEVWIIN